MLQVERVADDVYVFTSDLYAQVTAGAVITPAGAALIDTLLFPQETREMRKFIEKKLECPIRYLILTHYHADHTYGASFFPEAEVVSHALCRNLMDTVGREGLKRAQAQNSELRGLKLVLPEVIFDDGSMELHLGNKTMILNHSPGHSEDLITVLVKEDKVLFASDTMMPIPVLSDGDYKAYLQSLENILDYELENVVQGHGEVVLRGEIGKTVEYLIEYITAVEAEVKSALEHGKRRKDLAYFDLPSMGRSAILLSGLVADLHEANLDYMYDLLKQTVEPLPHLIEDDPDDF